MLTFAAILVLQTEEIQKNHRLSDGYKTCPKRCDRVFETWLHVGIWIDATGINWSSCHESQHPLWAQKDKEGLTDSETYTTSSLSIPTDPRTSAGLLHVFVKLWNKKQHNTWHKFHSFWYCHYTWKVTVSVALHISQSLHVCIVCIEENIEFLWFIAITRCWFLIIVNEEIFCL